MNALRSLLEEHDHLVQEISGSADHGEDLYVAFTAGSKRTGHVIAVQAKAGKKFKRSTGYAIPIGSHREDWQQLRIPVVGVVYDVSEKRLFWVNISKALSEAPSGITWIPVAKTDELNGDTIKGFVADLQVYADVAGKRAGKDEYPFTGALTHESEPNADEAPNELFSGIADFFVSRPFLMKNGRTLIYTVMLLCALIIEYPYQIKFASTYLPDQPPVFYVMGLYGLVVFLCATIYSEGRAGRRATGTQRILVLLVSNYATLPFQMGDGHSRFDELWGKGWAMALVLGSPMVMVFVGSIYARREMDRRTRPK
ncbi:hypothetical protein SMCF_1530 [Streptomyces coelicoflavus ZG0656]|nr:hypothetical protein SMCF_1530 [Streptomyces coelicoflavus ZG0656]MZE47108.1 DUF4365 domain-containing protein [Streptomyces sp. SID5477]